MNKWCVYILRLNDGSLYTGITNDIDKRIKKHAAGKGSKYVGSRLPLQVVYVESHKDRSSASKREYKIKQMTKKQKTMLISMCSKIKE